MQMHFLLHRYLGMRTWLTIGTYIHGPEKLTSHMMARTRSSHLTLEKRLMKQATPYQQLYFRVKAQLDNLGCLESPIFNLSDISSAVGTGVSDASSAPTTHVIDI